MAIHYDPKRPPGQCNCVAYNYKFTYEVQGCNAFNQPVGDWVPEQTETLTGRLGPLALVQVKNDNDCTGVSYQVSGKNNSCVAVPDVGGFNATAGGKYRNVSLVVLGRTDGFADDCGLPNADIRLPPGTYILLPCVGGWSGCTVSVPPGSPLIPGVDPGTGRPTLLLPGGGVIPDGGTPFTVSEDGGPGSYPGTAYPGGGVPPNTPPGRIPGGTPPGSGPGTADDTSPGSKTITWSGTIPDGPDQIIDGTQLVSYTVTYDDGTQIVVPLNVDTTGGAPIVYRDNTTIAVDWSGTNSITVYTQAGEVYYVGQPYISVYSSPLFTQGSLAHIKRLKHLLVFMDNTKGLDIYLPGDERVDGVRGKARQEINCNFSIIYNNELDGSNYSSTYDYNSIFWEEALFSDHVSAKQLNNYVMLKEPLLGYGYGYQLVVWNVDGATWTLAGYQIDAPMKGKKYLNTNE